MADPRLRGEELGAGRRWTFADCCFDEASWTLTVAGERVTIEGKPLEILRQLLMSPGQLLTKDVLFDAVWPNVAVVEASLPTAVRKLRLALRDDDRAQHIVETVPRLGYRLGVPVSLVSTPSKTPVSPASSFASPVRQRAAAVAVVLIVALGLSTLVSARREAEAAQGLSHPGRAQVLAAIRRMDVDTIQGFIDAGWDVNTPLDKHYSIPLSTMIEQCEWNPGHDRERMLLMARTMIDAGADPTSRNSFGDTAYSIAKAERFCGPDHPVTVMLRNLCFNGGGANTYGERCLASYELSRRNRPSTARPVLSR